MYLLYVDLLISGSGLVGTKQGVQCMEGKFDNERLISALVCNFLG